MYLSLFSMVRRALWPVPFCLKSSINSVVLSSLLVSLDSSSRHCASCSSAGNSRHDSFLDPRRLPRHVFWQVAEYRKHTALPTPSNINWNKFCLFVNHFNLSYNWLLLLHDFYSLRVAMFKLLSWKVRLLLQWQSQNWLLMRTGCKEPIIHLSSTFVSKKYLFRREIYHYFLMVQQQHFMLC